MQKHFWNIWNNFQWLDWKTVTDNDHVLIMNDIWNDRTYDKRSFSPSRTRFGAWREATSHLTWRAHRPVVVGSLYQGVHWQHRYSSGKCNALYANETRQRWHCHGPGYKNSHNQNIVHTIWVNSESSNHLKDKESIVIWMRYFQIQGNWICRFFSCK